RERIQQLLRSHLAMAQRLAALVDAHAKFERVAPVPFSVVCFRYRGSDDDNRAILDAVNSSGKVYLSHTALAGRYVLRLAIGNMGTTWDDVQLAWELIEQAIPRMSASGQVHPMHGRPRLRPATCLPTF